MRRLRSQTGQTAAEYLGILLLVSVLIAGVAHNDIGHRIGCQMRARVAKILGGDAPQGCGDHRGGPRATASAASADRDSDKDGIPDAEEIRRGTDPYSSDSDHDGVSDKDEIEAGLNPRNADTDYDGLPDGVELDRDSDPFNPDTDGDHSKDGDDKDPTHYDASWTDAIKGATCGDSDFLICPDKDDPVRASTEYLTGQLLSGVFAIGDVRDIINALAHGKVGDALWSAVGFAPAVAKHWPASRRSEALGVETALAELKKNPNIDVIFDGRPRAGRPSNGPDIVAVDRNTGRTIVVEAKGTQGRRPLSGRTLRSTAGGNPVTQTQYEWLRDNPGRYLTPLRRSNSAGDQEAARRLAGIVNNGDNYDVVIVNSRPAGTGGYGSGVDTATDDIRRSGRVGSLDLIDVQRP